MTWPTYHPFKPGSTALRLATCSALALSVLVHLHLVVVIVERHLSTFRVCGRRTSLSDVLIILFLKVWVAQVNRETAWVLAKVLL